MARPGIVATGEHQRAALHDLFDVRLAIAALGSPHWMGWWEVQSLTDHGQYALKRVFRRTPILSGADLAIRTARARQADGLPKEPLVHLFDFGETLESAFERWLIRAKEEGRQITLPSQPTEQQKHDVATALSVLGITPRDDLSPSDGSICIGNAKRALLESEDGVVVLARQLAGAYATSGPRKLVVPFLRLTG